MKRKEGILAALDNEVSLEDKIAIELDKVLSDNTLTERYTDPQDKQNVVQRELIVKALEIIYEHNSEKFKSDEDSAIVQISDELDPLGELFGALRCLRHDTKRLNEGMEAERVAKPVIRESITGNEIILIDRKLRILWYVASELHTNADKDLFKTQKALEEHAATILDSTPGALKTGRSQLKSKGDATEQEFFYKHINEFKQSSKESGGQISPLRLLLPALEALSRD
tara:strand:+ start:147 stop:827 length:681 start_codon:yes stop_codon:yes gene_type:complete